MTGKHEWYFASAGNILFVDGGNRAIRADDTARPHTLYEVYGIGRGRAEHHNRAVFIVTFNLRWRTS